MYLRASAGGILDALRAEPSTDNIASAYDATEISIICVQGITKERPELG